MKKLIRAIVFILAASIVFPGCSSTTKIHNNGNSGSSFSLLPSNKINRQIQSNTVLDRQSKCDLVPLFNYSFTNGKKCIDSVYKLKIDTDTLPDDSQTFYEENFYSFNRPRAQYGHRLG